MEDAGDAKEIQFLADSVTANLPASEDCLTAYGKAQQDDTVCAQLLEYCCSGWPGKHSLYPETRQYWEHRGSLTVVNNLLLFGCCIVVHNVPKALQEETLGKLHEGHQKCRERAKRNAVWWSGISREVETVKKCRVCAKHLIPSREPLKHQHFHHIHGTL